jgi:hypothetical protein
LRLRMSSRSALVWPVGLISTLPSGMATVAVAVAAGVVGDMRVNRLGHDRLAGVVGEQHGPKDDLLVHEARDLCRDLGTSLAQVPQLLGERLDGLFATVDQLSRARVLEQGGGAACDAAVACHGVQQLVAFLGGIQNLAHQSSASSGNSRGVLLLEPSHVPCGLPRGQPWVRFLWHR